MLKNVEMIAMKDRIFKGICKDKICTKIETNRAKEQTTMEEHRKFQKRKRNYKAGKEDSNGNN